MRSNYTSIDSMALAGVFLLVFMVFHAVFQPNEKVLPERLDLGSGQAEETKLENKQFDPDKVEAPYDEYVVTQRLHGFSYGHAAVDLAAGKDAEIKSPISGRITEFYIDQWGNPTLVIENDRYRVLLLHGVYSVDVGDTVVVGDQIGRESNLGYTVDFQGRLCAGRDCGYHTHLNIYDKDLGENVNPLALFDR